MGEYLDAFINGYKGYAQYLWYEITHQHCTIISIG